MSEEPITATEALKRHKENVKHAKVTNIRQELIDLFVEESVKRFKKKHPEHSELNAADESLLRVVYIGMAENSLDGLVKKGKGDD
ncbi:MAG: hypothetical protein MI745_14215 [Pseudomonadales bacterium]|nr:hypothetical protein [Pseudomonadales bacterium]